VVACRVERIFLCLMQKKPLIINFEEAELKKLGNRIRELRKSQGHATAEKAANEYGLQRSQYTRYEAGANLTYVSLVSLLKKMKVTIPEFFSEGFG